MTAALRHLEPAAAGLDRTLRWREADSGCVITLSRPDLDPGLWSEYGRGAERSYRRHGVECALDHQALRTGADTVMFMAVLDGGDHLLGGVRAIGPLRSAQDSHAVSEWAGHPGQAAVHKVISDRVPFGVLEMKSAWIRDEEPGRSPVTDALARSGFHMMALLNIRFCMATAAAGVLTRWRSSGGVVSPIPATPYPNHRYHTRLMWWDRSDFIRHARPEQADRITNEIANLPRPLRPPVLR